MSFLFAVFACFAPATPIQPPAPEVEPLPAGPSPRPSEGWIPEQARNCKVAQRIDMDVDGDSLQDLVAVLEATESAGGETDRLFVLARRTEEGLRRHVVSPCVALCQGCGGMMGDPFGGIQRVGKRSVKIDNHGGSAWRWSDRRLCAPHVPCRLERSTRSRARGTTASRSSPRSGACRRSGAARDVTAACGGHRRPGTRTGQTAGNLRGA